MGKKSRRKAHRHSGSATAAYIPPLNSRPFAGLANELELAAMRELIPAASLELTTTSDYGAIPITFVTLAPSTAQGIVRSDGKIMVALQTRSRTLDPGHDIALVTEKLLTAEPGTVLDRLDLRQRGPQLRELFGDAVGELQIHHDLGFWLTDEERTPEAEEVIARSSQELIDCELVPGQRATLWTRMNADFVRLVHPADEDDVFRGLARLQARGELQVANDNYQAQFIGAFRMCGLATPVWEFSRPVSASEIAEPVRQLRERLDKAVAQTTALNAAERNALEGIISRQVSVR